MDPTHSLAKSLGAAQDALADVARAETHDLARERLVWLERQLAHLILQLHYLIADLDAGMSIVDLGFSAEEFDDMIIDLDIEIANLRGLIRIAKDLGR